MKKYSELSIDQKINFKANMQAKGIAYGSLLKYYMPMQMDAVVMDLKCYAYDALYNWGPKYKGGYQIK